jgi:hypothetical protein
MSTQPNLPQLFHNIKQLTKSLENDTLTCFTFEKALVTARREQEMVRILSLLKTEIDSIEKLINAYSSSSQPQESDQTPMIDNG